MIPALVQVFLRMPEPDTRSLADPIGPAGRPAYIPIAVIYQPGPAAAGVHVPGPAALGVVPE